MSARVEVTSEVERDVVTAFSWYERERRGLGHEFLRAFDAAIQRAARRPFHHPRIGSLTRKIVMRRFPYLVYYMPMSDRVLVVAVFHAHRDASNWSDRVRESFATQVA